jgi:hypothetical protein
MPSHDAAVADQHGSSPHYVSGLRERVEAGGDRRPAALRLRRVHRCENRQQQQKEREADSGAPAALGGGSPRNQRE